MLNGRIRFWEIELELRQVILRGTSLGEWMTAAEPTSKQYSLIRVSKASMVQLAQLAADLLGEPQPQRWHTTANGAHFVLVVGFTAEGFWVHDPLWPDEHGAFRTWSVEVMGAALARPGWGNMPMQGVVVQQVYKIAEPEMGELGLAVSAVMQETSARHYLEQLYDALGVAAEGSLAERQGHALAMIALLGKSKTP